MNKSIPGNKTLAIVGPHESGKSTLAREIARKEGEFVEVDARDLDTPGGVDRAARNAPAVIICDGFPTREEALRRIKDMVMTPTIRVKAMYREPIEIKSPKFIFCVTESFDRGLSRGLFDVVETACEPVMFDA